ncbi:hypothetical protein Pcinc_040035 [Petrolisthes cinctipes]|uniref:RING-type domain-containing protein n=1 Tax=Petrolisthes cinctipes TaxID=88211 RepID=A0AAE1EJY7_PETCI|nr:hypothetical protein Pcinc_040035 [Petrolisthes cinctipes]
MKEKEEKEEKKKEVEEKEEEEEEEEQEKEEEEEEEMEEKEEEEMEEEEEEEEMEEEKKKEVEEKEEEEKMMMKEKKSYSEGERRPLMLPACGHTFCHLCLATLVARNSEEGSFQCPTCRHLQSLRDLNALPVNYSLLEVVARRQRRGASHIHPNTHNGSQDQHQDSVGSVRIRATRLVKQLSNASEDNTNSVTTALVNLAEQLRQRRRLHHLLQESRTVRAAARASTTLTASTAAATAIADIQHRFQDAHITTDTRVWVGGPGAPASPIDMITPTPNTPTYIYSPTTPTHTHIFTYQPTHIFIFNLPPHQHPHTNTYLPHHPHPHLPHPPLPHLPPHPHPLPSPTTPPTPTHTYSPPTTPHSHLYSFHTSTPHTAIQQQHNIFISEYFKHTFL